MKRIHEALQEAQYALQEYDPLAFDNAKKIVESAQAMVLASLTPRRRTIRPRENQTHIPHCEYCGRTNAANGSWIGAKLDDDPGFTIVEGTSKMACADCYPIAREEAEEAMA